MIFMILEKIILTSVIFGVTLGIAMYLTLAERKFAAFFQDRIGPNRAGPFGLLQPLADGVKFFFKEEFFPKAADPILFVLGPMIALITSAMAIAIIPWGNTIVVMGRTVMLQVADLDVGVLFGFAMVSFGVYGIMIGGWASNNKFSVLSAIRASAQMISYELAMGTALVALIMTTGTLSLREIVMQQAGWHWNVLLQPLGFLLFLICSFAETNRTPFDLAECETELIGGYHTEYSSMKLGLYLFAEYIAMFLASVMMTVLYFGGYNLPFLHLSGNFGGILGVFITVGKALCLCFLFIWVRWTVPRFRFDQLMRLGWRVLIPLSLMNLVVTGFWMLLGGK